MMNIKQPSYRYPENHYFHLLLLANIRVFGNNLLFFSDISLLFMVNHLFFIKYTQAC